MANTLYVGSDQKYTSIQAAIDAAQNGDTIVLKGNVTSTKSISIVDKNITVDLGGFTLDAQVYIKNASEVEFKNGSMTYTNADPSFGSAVITTGIYTDENGDTFSYGGAAALTLTGVNIYGGEAVDSRNYTHAVYYKSTGGLTITDCTVTGGKATRTENSTITRTENNTAHGIYASSCDGDIVIKNSTISGGYGNSEGETRINAGHPVGGGDAIYLSGKSNVTIEDSTVSGGSSKWYNANAGINVTNQFSGTLTVVDSTVTGGTAEGKNPSSSTSGIGGVGIYTNMNTSCKEITITGSTISGGDGGMSWNGSGIEYRNANIKLTITGSTVEAGNGENASDTGTVGALWIGNSTSTQIVLDDVELNGEGNGNAVIYGGDKGITVTGPVEIVGGTLENTKIDVDATDFEGTAAIITGDTDGVEVSVTGNENAAVIVEGGKTYITTETDPAAADTSVIYVNSAWADAAENQLVGAGKFFGVNAFATSKKAYMAARDIGGEITIDLSGAGAETLDGTIGLGNAGKNGIYTITGGTVDTTSYGLSFANTETTVKFQDATFKLAKLYVANAGGSLIVDDSVIGTAFYSGHGGGWVTAGQGSISINNSVFGANFSNFTAEELADMPRSASAVKAAVEAGTYEYWKFGANNSGPHMGTAGEIKVTASTLSTAWISLIDRAEMVLNNSVLYYGAAISIGAGQVDNSYGPYNSNEIGWDAQIWWNPPLSSADGFREGKAATLTIENSIVRNIGNGNGNSGAHIQVGGSYVNGKDKSVTGECAGVLNIINSEFYTTPYDAEGNAVAKKYDMIVVKNNGTVNVDKSTVVTAQLVNEGAFNVTGESTLKINSATGEAVKFIDGTLTDSNIQGTVNAYGKTVFRGTNNIKVLATGRDSNYKYVTTTQILGNFTTTNMLTGTVNADSKVYIGAANEERTTAYFGQLGGFGKVAVENADVTYGYAFIRNNFDVKNSTLENESVNTYFAGNAKVVVDNSTWTTGAYTAVGSYGGYMYGNADVIIQNDSTLSAGNFDIENGGDYIVKVTVDNAALEASSRITLAAGTSLTLLNGAVAETALVTNNGTITVNADSFLTAATITNNGTIIIDAAGFAAGVGKSKTVIDLNGEPSTKGTVAFKNLAKGVKVKYDDGDVILVNAGTVAYFDDDWPEDYDFESSGKIFGTNAFADVSVIDPAFSDLVFADGFYGALVVDHDMSLSSTAVATFDSITVKEGAVLMMGVDSQIKVTGDITGSIILDAAGWEDEENKGKVIIDVAENWDGNVEEIIANWSDVSKYFTIDDTTGDLTVVADQDKKVVTLKGNLDNTDYSNNDEVVLIITDKEVVIGSGDHVGHNGADGKIEGGTFGATVSGGSVINNSKTDPVEEITTNTNMEVGGGEFSRLLIGADRVDGGEVNRSGAVSTTITEGTFDTVVLGGSYAPAGSAIINSSVSLTIKGGTFKRTVYGGSSAQNDADGSTIAINGNVYFTVDTSDQEVTFKKSIIAGSYQSGAIKGDINVTFTGSADNLDVADGFQVWGGCSSDYYTTDSNGNRVFETAVEGNRIFTFDDFDGSFNNRIRGFNTFELINGSDVEIDNKVVDLSDIETWKLEVGSTLSGEFVNDFSGDKIVIDVTEWAADADSYDLISGSSDIFEGLDILVNDIEIIGAAAADFELNFDEANGILSIKKGTLA